MSSLAIAPSLNSNKWLSKASSQENLQRSLLLNVQAVFTGRLTESRGECTKLTQKSNRQPYQELWSALTNLSPLFFVPIAKGQPTVRRYRGASVFVDHASEFTYVHMHQHLTTDETIDAKHAFERLAEQHGVRILHYHCDNGRFANKAFVDDVRAAHQTITFCGVGVHHQNGITERRIRDITEHAHTSLLHAAHRWPKAIAANLWPQAIKHVVNVRNSLPRPGKTESPLSKFAGTSVQPNLKHFHPFGCPVYVLQAPLQARSPFPRWGERSRIGIFLCHSPHHASSVPLVLSTQTGLVSPQFHCVFDDDFDTVKKEQADTSIWKVKAHLQEAKEQAAEVTTQSSLISGPKYQPTTSLCPYSRDILVEFWGLPP